ncbi:MULTISPECIES: c-type cytochrome [unclassified Janthinobacterium]|uniref:c-type cytochrome n=1 Tax=unclassified Janthinobacterium TaxID=2610881 RepID=UPI00098393AE|nr:MULTISPECIES: c-type cytochrome [unclassified Janthinobacterium]AQR67503.1 cytochrome c4 [Janthinobacterium sp. LM6]MDN2678817.1 c-type cytochrome [Janthinobacterium sp. SUN033]MDN2718287.1 c-type cytochrome [Janthinobacterium sp. SUN120]MDO8068146.1 c-type cytochrome [Janthinobacterium sp. SUN206]MDO8074413.1 c-type cytochrome [Janthinobacterium sp. SUN176]
MNRAFSPFIKSMLLALLAVSATASAVEAAKPAVKADAAKGATLYADGDAARGLPACVSCHGAAGNSTITVNPKLAGQHESYIYKQLVDFTTPERSQPVMTTYAKMLSDADKKNIAAYLGAQLSKPGAAKNKDTIDLGKKIYRGGIASKQVAACASCHGATGNGIPVQYPRIAGQHQDYTVAQLTMFRSTKADARKNSAQMHTIAARMSDDEIAAVADYIAGLK